MSILEELGSMAASSSASSGVTNDNQEGLYELFYYMVNNFMYNRRLKSYHW